MSANGNGSGTELRGKQAAALAALLAQPTVADAAKAAKVSLPTLWRYLRDPAFAPEYRAGRREVVSHAVMRLQADSAQAAKVLRDIADDTQAPASARVTAARVILETAFKGIELLDHGERIAQLEELLAAQKGQRA